jgi:magnesium-transporting ATPase (P-type)
VEPGCNLELFTALALSNDANTDASGTVLGDPTEVALYAVAKLYGFDKKVLEEDFPRVAEIPFDSARKCMTTLHKLPADSPFKAGGEGAWVSFTKGAVDVMLDKAAPVDGEKWDHGMPAAASEGKYLRPGPRRPYPLGGAADGSGITPDPNLVFKNRASPLADHGLYRPLLDPQ